MIHKLTVLALLTLGVAGTFAQDFGDFGMGGMGGNQRCKQFSCSKGYAPAPKRRMKFTSAGCDAMGGGAMMFTPGSGDSKKPYESCCDEWHACFQVCGASKQSCDDSYKKCVDITCKLPSNDEKSCQESSKMTTMMLQLSGCNSYDAAQNQACECASKTGDAHVKKREDALKKFYRMNAPDSIHKVPDLMKKADTEAKFASLLRKLIHKYPECIEHVEDPQTKMYREMMDNASKKTDLKDEDKEMAEEEEGDDDIEDFDATEHDENTEDNPEEEKNDDEFNQYEEL